MGKARAPKQDNEADGKKSLRSVLGIGLLIVLIVGIVVLFLLSARADEVDGKLADSEATMKLISENLEKFGMKYGYEKVGEVTPDTDLGALASTIVDSAVVISPEAGEHIVAQLSPAANFEIIRMGKELHATPESLAVLKENARQNISPGDQIYRLQVSNSSKSASTTVVISADGKKKIGMFLNGSRIPVPTPRPNPPSTDVEAERTMVLTRYLWNAPAETLYGKILGQCGDATCNSCQLVEARGESGFFASIITSPKAIIDGKIVGNCCRESINYKVETGFTKLSLKDGAVEGHLGQSSDGAMFLQACGQ